MQDSAGEPYNATNFKATLNSAWNSNSSVPGKHKSCTGGKCTTQNKKKRWKKKKTFKGIICSLKEWGHSISHPCGFALKTRRTESTKGWYFNISLHQPYTSKATPADKTLQVADSLVYLRWYPRRRAHIVRCWLAVCGIHILFLGPSWFLQQDSKVRSLASSSALLKQWPEHSLPWLCFLSPLMIQGNQRHQVCRLPLCWTTGTAPLETDSW